jgi:hypothetical protein
MNMIVKQEILTPVAIIDNLEELKNQDLFSHPNYNKLIFARQDFDLVKQFLLK